VRAADLLDVTPSVMLKEGLSPNDYDGILAVTPEDVARSPRLRWLYVARRGWVHAVENYERGIRVLRS